MKTVNDYSRVGGRASHANAVESDVWGILLGRLSTRTRAVVQLMLQPPGVNTDWLPLIAAIRRAPGDTIREVEASYQAGGQEADLWRVALILTASATLNDAAVPFFKRVVHAPPSQQFLAASCTIDGKLACAYGGPHDAASRLTAVDSTAVLVRERQSNAASEALLGMLNSPDVAVVRATGAALRRWATPRLLAEAAGRLRPEQRHVLEIKTVQPNDVTPLTRKGAMIVEV